MGTSLILKAIQAKIASHGLDWIKLEDLHLDSRANIITLDVSLQGEEKPVKAEVCYSLGAANTLVIREVTLSKPWMTEAVKLAMCKTGNRIELPGGIPGKMIRMLL
jgi:hypothetical protein